ncbi:MAG TPA: hypothetical protein VMJ31_05275 [Methylocystis sp.]|nr:hypothetical protein [Methylocystis sp.]
MQEREESTELTMFGGPLHRLGLRLKLVRGEANSTLLGLVLGLGLWSILAILVHIAGAADRLFSLTAIAADLRLLVVIPLLFLCESVLAPRMREFVATIARSGVVRLSDLPLLQAELARARRWTDSWLPDAFCLLIGVALSFLASGMNLSGNTAAFEPRPAMAETHLASWWYWYVCLPLFRFLILRWIWRIAIWSFFLWRLSKLDLDLSPIHPDHAGGLGYLEVVQTHFVLLTLAASILMSASLAEDMASGEAEFDEILPALALNLVAQIMLICLPTCVFLLKLKACQMKGLSDYTTLAASYVYAFEKKWIKRRADLTEPLLGTPDLQSLSDLSSSVGIIRNMRWIPVSMRLLLIVAVAALSPMTPLLLFKYPAGELTRRLFSKLVGL